MYAIEFETDIKNGMVRIPEKYAALRNRHARVVILLDEENVDSVKIGQDDTEFRALSNHSASNIEEWHDIAEDDVWK